MRSAQARLQTRLLFTSVSIVALIVAAVSAAPAPEGSASPLLASIEFSVGSGGSGVGLLGTGVAAELAGELGVPAGGGVLETFDDIYLQAYIPPGGYGWTNVKHYDDGGFLVGAPGTLLEPPSSLTIRTATGTVDGHDIDSYAIIDTSGLVTAAPASTALAGLFVQFSVDVPTAAFPTPGAPDVATEAASGEAMGDVFEAFGPGGPGMPLMPPMPGGNTLISDESAHGLTSVNATPASPDNLDAMIINESSLGTGIVINTDDTGGGTPPDMPLVFFTFNPASPGGLPVGVGSGADLCIPGVAAPGFPAADPFVDAGFANFALAPGDSIDALYIDASGMNAIFSLAPGSPSLPTIPNPFTGGLGAAPSDLLHVGWPVALPHGGALVAPSFAPMVCLEGATIGLVPGPANIDAVWVTSTPIGGAGLVPVELSVFAND